MTRVPQIAFDRIKQYEGLRLEAYKDTNGTWTIGYGTTAAAEVGIEPKKGMTITPDQADFYLFQGVVRFAEKLAPLIKVPVTDNELAACLSLAYNIGPIAFKSSTVLRELNMGHRKQAAAAFVRWNKETIGGVKVVNKGLTKRRESEAALFLKP